MFTPRKYTMGIRWLHYAITLAVGCHHLMLATAIDISYGVVDDPQMGKRRELQQNLLPDEMFVFEGCFEDDPDRNFNHRLEGAKKLTLEECAKVAYRAGATTFSMQGPYRGLSECYCNLPNLTETVPGESPYDRRPDAECIYYGQLLGGVWRNAVYKFPPRSGDVAYEYKGCFQDADVHDLRNFNYFVGWKVYKTVHQCAQLAYRAGSVNFAMQSPYGGSSMCWYNLPDQSFKEPGISPFHRLDDAACKSEGQLLGGSGHNAVYNFITRNIDECSSDANKCDVDNGICLQLNGNYLCSCKAGFILANDDRTCVEYTVTTTTTTAAGNCESPTRYHVCKSSEIVHTFEDLEKGSITREACLAACEAMRMPGCCLIQSSEGNDVGNYLCQFSVATDRSLGFANWQSAAMCTAPLPTPPDHSPDPSGPPPPPPVQETCQADLVVVGSFLSDQAKRLNTASQSASDVLLTSDNCAMGGKDIRGGAEDISCQAFRDSSIPASRFQSTWILAAVDHVQVTQGGDVVFLRACFVNIGSRAGNISINVRRCGQVDLDAEHVSLLTQDLTEDVFRQIANGSSFNESTKIADSYEAPGFGISLYEYCSKTATQSRSPPPPPPQWYLLDGDGDTFNTMDDQSLIMDAGINGGILGTGYNMFTAMPMEAACPVSGSWEGDSGMTMASVLNIQKSMVKPIVLSSCAGAFSDSYFENASDYHRSSAQAVSARARYSLFFFGAFPSWSESLTEIFRNNGSLTTMTSNCIYGKAAYGGQLESDESNLLSEGFATTIASLLLIQERITTSPPATPYIECPYMYFDHNFLWYKARIHCRNCVADRANCQINCDCGGNGGQLDLQYAMGLPVGVEVDDQATLFVDAQYLNCPWTSTPGLTFPTNCEDGAYIYEGCYQENKYDVRMFNDVSSSYPPLERFLTLKDCAQIAYEVGSASFGMQYPKGSNGGRAECFFNSPNSPTRVPGVGPYGKRPDAECLYYNQLIGGNYRNAVYRFPSRSTGQNCPDHTDKGYTLYRGYTGISQRYVLEAHPRDATSELVTKCENNPLCIGFDTAGNIWGYGSYNQYRASMGPFAPVKYNNSCGGIYVQEKHTNQRRFDDDLQDMLFSKYGTHVITEVTLGSKITVCMQMSKTAQAVFKSSEFKLRTYVIVGFWFASVMSSFKSSQTEESSIDTKTYNYTVSVMAQPGNMNPDRIFIGGNLTLNTTAQYDEMELALDKLGKMTTISIKTQVLHELIRTRAARNQILSIANSLPG